MTSKPLVAPGLYQAHAPGIYEMTDAEYFDLPYISKSSLDLIAKSPANYLYWKTQGDRPRSRAMELGSAAHCGILEPDDFEKRFVRNPGIDRRTKAGKEQWDEFSFHNGDKTVLSPEDFDTCLRMIDAVQAHVMASALLRKGKAEQAILWTSEVDGLPSKGKADWLTEDIIVDLKTSESATVESFAKSIANYRYEVQAAYYLDGIQRAVPHKRFNSFLFLVVESKPPYHVAVYAPDKHMLEAGRLLYERDLRRLANCLRTNEWPGLGETIQEISMPTWAMKKGA